MSADQLVLQFMGLADALSRRYRAPGCEAEDLRQVARLGLVKAAKRYRESGNHGFMAFAVPTINGELKRHLRDHSWVAQQIQQNGPPTSYEDRGHHVILAVEDPAYERVEQALTLKAALKDSSEEDRRLLHLRFVLELSQGQIAQEFGVSQMQISRSLKRVLDRLRRRLTEPAKN